MGSRGIGGGCETPLEAGAFAWRGSIAILVIVAFGLSTRAPIDIAFIPVDDLTRLGDILTSGLGVPSSSSSSGNLVK